METSCVRLVAELADYVVVNSDKNSNLKAFLAIKLLIIKQLPPLISSWSRTV